jgi:hypothetical protein
VGTKRSGAENQLFGSWLSFLSWGAQEGQRGRSKGRVALGIAPQGSHRSRRADFPHLARHVAGSLSLARSISLARGGKGT